MEPYVSATVVAEYLGVEKRQVLALTRAGKLPAHPIDPTAVRKIWRYKLSQVDAAVAGGASKPSKNEVAPECHPRDNPHGSPRSRRG